LVVVLVTLTTTPQTALLHPLGASSSTGAPLTPTAFKAIAAAPLAAALAQGFPFAAALAFAALCAAAAWADMLPKVCAPAGCRQLCALRGAAVVKK